MLPSRFSRVRLCATPETAAHQAPPSLRFSRQEHWRGLPFPSPMHESEKWKGSRSVLSCSSDPVDCSLPGSSVRGIFQARVLEWGAIAFSSVLVVNEYKNVICIWTQRRGKKVHCIETKFLYDILINLVVTWTRFL